MVLREAAQHDVDRALPVLRGVGDECEDASLGRLLDEPGIGSVDEEDHRAGGLVDDLLDQAECVLGALAEPDERHVGSLTSRDTSHVFHLDLARDHFVTEFGDDRRDERQAILPLVGDQNPQVLGLAVAHSRSDCSRVAFPNRRLPNHAAARPRRHRC